MAGEDENARAQELCEGLLRAIRTFLDEHVAPGPGAPAAPADQHLQLATAVLFFAMVRADHEIRQDEHQMLVRALRDVLGLGTERALSLIRLAEQGDAQLAPLSEYLNELRRWLPYEQKKRILEALWRLAYADAELQGHEEYLARKVADLLDLSKADLMETKVRAREAFFDAP
jgi:uncharacterized tellurite resistance protein B-like protein